MHLFGTKTFANSIGTATAGEDANEHKTHINKKLISLLIIIGLPFLSKS
jgi:hypothetical protein